MSVLVTKSDRKVDYLSKKVKKYLICEFQKTCTFEVTCWKMIQIFQVKNLRRFVILVSQSFFGTSKLHEKLWIFCIKISIVQKKSWCKNAFSQITHMQLEVFFFYFWKKSIFFDFFCSNLHFKKKMIFCLFLKNFLQQGSWYYYHNLFFVFVAFFVKNVLFIEREVFFFQNKKMQIEHPYRVGSSFFKLNFLDY